MTCNIVKTEMSSRYFGAEFGTEKGHCHHLLEQRGWNRKLVTSIEIMRQRLLK